MSIDPSPIAPGRFVTFEGIDGAGKSSHVEALAAWARGRGAEVVLTREPGGTPLAERLRELFLHEGMDALTEALLVFAGRRDHLRARIEPALARGALVLCDRFTDATFAYQGAGRGFDTGVLATLEAWVQGGEGQGSALLQPDLTLWFDLAPDIAARRLAGARLPDKFESQPVAFFQRVAQGYAARVAADPGRFERIEAAAPREAVGAQVEAAVRRRGWLDCAAAKRLRWRPGWPARSRTCCASAATPGCCTARPAWASTNWAWLWPARGCASGPSRTAPVGSVRAATPSTCARTPTCARCCPKP